MEIKQRSLIKYLISFDNVYNKIENIMLQNNKKKIINLMIIISQLILLYIYVTAMVMLLW